MWGACAPKDGKYDTLSEQLAWIVSSYEGSQQRSSYERIN